MPTTFSRSMRSLAADSFRASLWGIFLVVALLLAAAAWFFFARVELYESARNARLEVEREVHPVAALLAGRVAQTSLALGRKVQPGDLLVELDSESEKLRVAEERSRLDALSRRLEALRNEIGAEEQAWREEHKTARLAIDEAKARFQESDTAAKFVEHEAKRAAELNADGLLAKSDFQKAQSEAQQKRAAATALSLTVNRQEAEVQSKEKGHEARVAKLKSEVATLEGDIGTSKAAIKRCEYDIEKRFIRAPIAGQLGEVATLRIGAFVNEGEKLAAVVPEGELKAVANFPPLAALGRIRQGQSARLRLDGFPWTQYGMLAGKVMTVANEPRDGAIRVELSVDPASAPLIPAQHGLPGTVEIKVDRVTPAMLVLRAVGKLLSGGKQ